MATNYNPRIVTDGLVLALDAGNRKSYYHNYHPKPVDGYGWVTSASAATLSRDTIQSPVGSTPLKMVVTGNDPYTSSYNSSSWNIASAAQGQTWTFSVWAKASTSTSGQLFLFEANSSGNYTNLSSSGINITTEWQRFSITRTFTNATTNYIQVRVDGPDFGGTGQTIWWDGFQVEKSSSMSTFTSGETSYNLINATNNGTLTNGVSYNDSNNGSFVFDGTDDYVNLPSSSTNLQNTSYTIFGFVKSDVSIQNGTSERYFYYFRGTTNGSNRFGVLFGFSTNVTSNIGKLELVIGDGGWNAYSSSRSSWNANTWYNIAVTQSGTTYKIYVDGIQTDTGTAVVPIFSGMDQNNFGHKWDGNISNGLVYNRALTPQEIQQNYNAMKSRFQ